MREVIHTPSAPNPIGPYSQAIKTGFIYLFIGSDSSESEKWITCRS